MPTANYNQINSSGNIAIGPNPPAFEPKAISDTIYAALNIKDYSFKWTQKTRKPYRGVLNDGESNIDLYIYVWNMTPAYRDNKSEKRIQIPATADDIGINRPISQTEKTIILGIYNSPAGVPLFTAWDPAANVGHGQKSCYVQIEDVAKAISKGIYQTHDRNGVPIYTMSPDYLADYVSLLQSKNVLRIPSSTASLQKRVNTANKKNRKKRTIQSVEKLHNLIASLPATEQEIISKARIGQGYFRDLLIEKYSCKCALCDIETKNMLVASHIKGWANSTDSEKLDENNGLLLCVHHDALFDKHLISFDDEGNIIISTELSEAECEHLGIKSIPKLSVSAKMKPYLAAHRRKVK